MVVVGDEDVADIIVQGGDEEAVDKGELAVGVGAFSLIAEDELIS